MGLPGREVTGPAAGFTVGSLRQWSDRCEHTDAAGAKVWIAREGLPTWEPLPIGGEDR